MNMTAVKSVFAAFAILILVTRLFDRNRRSLPCRFAPRPTQYNLLGQVLKQRFDVVVALGTGLAKRKLILICYIQQQIPNALPSSKLTTLLASRSVLFPTITQLTFWSMDLTGEKVTCSSRHTNAQHCQNSIGQWYHRRWWCRWRCDSSC